MRISDWSSDVCSSDLKALLRAEKVSKAGDKEAIARRDVLLRVRAALDQGICARAQNLSADDKALLRELFLLTLKPVMYVANVRVDGFPANPFLDRVRDRKSVV